MTTSAKFELQWTKAHSTSFANVEMDQKCLGEASLTYACWIWIQFGVVGLFSGVHNCAKFHGHWSYLASTCFTRFPSGQKLHVDDALTWVVGFGYNLV